jgi:type I restriction enzyme R subunit
VSPTPEQQARAGIDRLLIAAGWSVQDMAEAKKEGATLTGVEIQSARYAKGLPASLPAWRHPLPFLYESTGIETHFTSGLDPEPRARNVFAFHRPEMLSELVRGAGDGAAGAGEPPPSFLARMNSMPALVKTSLWPAQVVAIRSLEKSLASMSFAEAESFPWFQDKLDVLGSN